MQNSKSSSIKTPEYLIYISFALLIIHVVSIAFLTASTGQIFNEVLVLHPNGSLESPVLSILQIAAVLTGLPLIFIIPGLLFVVGLFPVQRSFIWYLGISFVSTLLLLMSGTSLLKVILPRVPGRSDFYLLIATLILIGSFLVFRNRNQVSRLNWKSILSRDNAISASLIILVMTIMALLLRDEIVVSNFNGDGAEVMLFAQSLRDRILPHAYIAETQLGFYAFFWLFAYPVYFAIMMLGETEAIARLPFFIYVSMAYLVTIGIIEIRRSRFNWIGRVSLLTGFILFVMLNTFYTTWFELYADIAFPGGVETMAALFLLFAAYFLFNERSIEFVVFALLANFTRPATIAVIAFLGVVSFLIYPHRRKVLVRQFFIYYVIFASYYMLYYLFTGDPTQFSPNHIFNMRFDLFNNLNRTAWMLLYFAIYVVFIPVITLFWQKQDDRISRVMSLTTIGTVLVILLLNESHFYYFTPVVFFAFAVFFRTVNRTHQSHLWQAGYAFLAGVLLLTHWPRNYPIYTYFGEIGDQTCAIFDNYEEFQLASDVLWYIDPLPAPDEQRWSIGDHLTFVYYATWLDCPGPSPDQYRFYYVASDFRDLIPDDYIKIWEGEGFVFFADSANAIERINNLPTRPYRIGLLKNSFRCSKPEYCK